ncbi:DUF2306 domain-containing protein [Pontivivens ytuae]|uniref:DUF2306 domain-containing protein n=2 Tax=Pontivivens ytuae TaxID=2789856 RepID=A0A7S9LVS2_9RHOB|nr:DUF2306 domain-containing protein [Pontivivens ytuae]
MAESVRRGWGGLAGLGLIVLLALPFVIYAAVFGWRGLTSDITAETHFQVAGGTAVNAGLFLHMLTGAMITALAPVQLVGALRRRWPLVHRTTGYLLAACAVPAAVGGLLYIGARGTQGGALMSAGFTVYGLLLLVSAVQAVRMARARRFEAHRAWALRFFVLAIGSWLYRLHYTLWYLATGGLWSEEDFSGGFDIVQNVAFWLPYLVLVELWLRRAGPVER